MTVTVEGAATLATTLALAAHRLDDMSRPGQSAASLVQHAGQARAPVRSGRLAGSLTRTVSDSEAAVSTSLVYAPVIHFGWRRHRIRPNPFLYPVLDNTQPVIVEGYATRCRVVLAGVRGA